MAFFCYDFARKPCPCRLRERHRERSLKMGWPETHTMKTTLKNRLLRYATLMRLDRPVGIWLVLAPAMWGLWLGLIGASSEQAEVTAQGFPDLKLLLIFLAGAVVMRSAGCVANDLADRKLDRGVARTRDRPLASGQVRTSEALGLLAVLLGVALVLVLFTSAIVIKLACVALALALVYPFCKRFTNMPQLVLGAAFAMAVPMAYAAQSGAITTPVWLVFTGVLLWTVAYDTFYAMADRQDDLRTGIKSTAILFGEADLLVIGSLQALFVVAMILAGLRFGFGFLYYLSLLAVGGLFYWQHNRAQSRKPDDCLMAFKNNQWVGLVVWLGIAAESALGTAT